MADESVIITKAYRSAKVLIDDNSYIKSSITSDVIILVRDATWRVYVSYLPKISSPFFLSIIVQWLALT